MMSRTRDPPAADDYLCRDDATAIPRALLERANLGRLRLQHWEAEAPNAIMGWTVFQPRREQWTRQRYESLRSRPQLENRAHHRTQFTGEFERYTPPEYIEMARACLRSR